MAQTETRYEVIDNPASEAFPPRGFVLYDNHEKRIILAPHYPRYWRTEYEAQQTANELNRRSNTQ